MRMALSQAGAGDPDKLTVRSQVFDRLRPAVAHTAAQAADHLENGVCQRSLVRHPAFDAFGNQFLLPFLELLVL